MRNPRIRLATRAMPALLLVACSLGACSAPEPPKERQRPQPQATSALADTANGYKEAARASVDAAQGAARRDQAELDAAAR